MRKAMILLIFIMLMNCSGHIERTNIPVMVMIQSKPAIVTNQLNYKKEQWVPVRYELSNITGDHIQVLYREAVFLDGENNKLYPKIGPFDTEFDISVDESIGFKDWIYVPTEVIVDTAFQGEKESSFYFNQKFYYINSLSNTNELTVQIPMCVSNFPENLVDLYEYETEYFKVIISKSFQKNEYNSNQTAQLLGLMDEMYLRLSNEVGFVPDYHEKIGIYMVSSEGDPHVGIEYSGNTTLPEDGSIHIPHWTLSTPFIWKLTGGKDAEKFNLFIFSHELAHYFLIMQFGFAPDWFLESPATYFANEVLIDMGYESVVERNIKVLEKYAGKYVRKDFSYYFDERWPYEMKKCRFYGEGYGLRLLEDLDDLYDGTFYPRLFNELIARDFYFDGNVYNQELLEQFITIGDSFSSGEVAVIFKEYDWEGDVTND